MRRILTVTAAFAIATGAVSASAHDDDHDHKPTAGCFELGKMLSNATDLYMINTCTGELWLVEKKGQGLRPVPRKGEQG
jgi:hypothetical protein